ncbi:MAG: carbon-nitrogen hydrolase family protein [Deltaproteobacteria bacterium]|nr:carbon-nitrogen hydrolase family protein [Deltaproteobacteria bacterium]
MKSFTIALIQMRVEEDRDANLARAAALLEQAAQRGAALAVLPEMFTCPYELGRFPAYAEPLADGPCGRLLSASAARLRLHVAGGSFPERRDGKIFNTATLWGPAGELLLVHRKVHLFDVNIPGGIAFQESACLSAGDEIAATHTELGVLGLAICYDLRFPEVFRALAIGGAEIVILPGAFNTTTGPAHWEPLLRARAIENTCYVAACSPAPTATGSYPCWGHSLLADPYGEIIVDAGREEQVVTAAIDAERLAQVRRALHVLAQRRPDAYRRAAGG